MNNFVYTYGWYDKQEDTLLAEMRSFSYSIVFQIHFFMLYNIIESNKVIAKIISIFFINYLRLLYFLHKKRAYLYRPYLT